MKRSKRLSWTAYLARLGLGVVLFVLAGCREPLPQHASGGSIGRPWRIADAAAGTHLTFRSVAVQRDGEVLWGANVTSAEAKLGGTGVTGSANTAVVIRRHDNEGRFVGQPVQKDTATRLQAMGASADSLVVATQRDGDESHVNISELDSSGRARSRLKLISDSVVGVRDLVWKRGVVYVTGYFGGELIAGEQTVHTAGSLDAFALAVELSSGRVRWLRRSGGVLSDSASAIAVHKDRVAVAGGFSWRADVGGKPVVSKDASPDGFITIYRALDGSTAGVVPLTGKGYDHVLDVAFTRDGSVCMTGSFQNELESQQVTLSARGAADVFVGCTDKSHQLRWLRQFGGVAHDHASGLVVSQGIVTLAASYYDVVSVGDKTLESQGESDIALVDYAVTTGEVRNAQSFGGDGYDHVSTVAKARNPMQLYIAGTSSDVRLVTSDDTKPFVARITR